MTRGERPPDAGGDPPASGAPGAEPGAGAEAGRPWGYASASALSSASISLTCHSELRCPTLPIRLPRTP